jgi:glucosyl-3-phosphoglycerate synthase
MSDFYQTGVVATFHRLGRPDIEKIEAELSWYSNERPIALVLPSLYSELEGDALKGIVRELREVKYIREIVVTLGPASADEFRKAKEFFSELTQETKIIWNTGPRLAKIYEAIKSAGLPIGEPGKGRSAWMAYGYVLSRQDFHVIALHDCDIVTYGRDMLARLCYPVTNPSLDYDFCKGFYSRVTDRMHGRATRLLVTPLIRSLQKIIGYHPLLVFFDSFRYPLAGEFSMDIDMARVNKIPGDWGLEVGVLAEVYRNTSLRRVCQVDIAENYEHKHQVLSPEDATMGLHKMCVDISKSVFRTLASEGIVFSHGLFKTLVATYVRTAQDLLKRFEDDAAINGLFFDRHEESLAVDTFTNGINKAAEIIMEDPLGVPLIASWDRVTSAIPDILLQIGKAVEADNA